MRLLIEPRVSLSFSFVYQNCKNIHRVLLPVAVNDLFDLSWVKFALVKIVLVIYDAIVLNKEVFALSVLTCRPKSLDDVKVAVG